MKKEKDIADMLPPTLKPALLDKTVQPETAAPVVQQQQNHLFYQAAQSTPPTPLDWQLDAPELVDDVPHCDGFDYESGTNDSDSEDDSRTSARLAQAGYDYEEESSDDDNGDIGSKILNRMYMKQYGFK